VASASVVGAVIERYGTFAFTPKPTMYFAEAPYRDGSGAAVVPPYVVLVDEGTVPDYDFEENPLEITRLRFEVYALGLALADAIASGIRYDGGSVSAGSGMDFTASLPLTGMTLKEMVREREQRFVEQSRDGSSTDVYRISMAYRVQVLRTA
jgi:hypothetical protein